MERLPLTLAQFDVDGGYLPGGDESAELAESLTSDRVQVEPGEEQQAPEDSLDASIFNAMLHP